MGRCLIWWPRDARRISGQDAIHTTNFGSKADGLLFLPPKWTPPYFLLHSTLHDQWRSHGQNVKINELLHPNEIVRIKRAIKTITKNGVSKVIIRSSAECEGLLYRGRFSSYVVEGTISNVFQGLESLFFNYAGNREEDIKFGVVVQKYIEPVIFSGHLSNERRIAPEANIWLSEIETAVESTIPSTIDIEITQDHNCVPTLKTKEHLKCGSIDDLQELWSAIAHWTIGFDKRLHYEWLWDGSVLWILQADEDHVRQDPGPQSARPQSASICCIPKLCFLKPAIKVEKGFSHKVDWLKTFHDQGMPIPDVFVLRLDKEVVSAIENDELPMNIRHDLSLLLEQPIVLRTDISFSKAEDSLFLPHSATVTSQKHALHFMKTVCQRVSESNLDLDRLVFLLHQYIPSFSAALSFADPEHDTVFIASTWGLPDGLQYYPHDSFYISERGHGRVEKQIRYKDTIVDVTDHLDWTLRPLGEPWDWMPSLSIEQVYAIAQGTAELSRYVDFSIQVMWLAGVHSTKYPDCLPWHAILDFLPDAAIHHDNLKSKKNKGHIFHISNEEDLSLLHRHISSNDETPKVIKLLPGTKLLRSKSLLKKVAKISKQYDMPVLLEGSVLSHAYYILRRAGVVVLTTEVKRHGGKP